MRIGKRKTKASKKKVEHVVTTAVVTSATTRFPGVADNQIIISTPNTRGDLSTEFTRGAMVFPAQE